MGVYVAMLRGINVGGHKKVPMKDLARVVEGVGATYVRTYIQSGNLVFSSLMAAAALTTVLEEAIESRFGFAVPVQLRSKRQLAALVSGNPMLRPGVDPNTLHVTFLDGAPPKAAVEEVAGMDVSPDSFVVVGHEVYVCCPKGYGNTKIHNGFFEKRLGVGATTRNWKTVGTLLEMTHA